tara:strand:- start:190 stop:351 length:162 start_codon:yes stop_codon:yes gene_type:complete
MGGSVPPTAKEAPLGLVAAMLFQGMLTRWAADTCAVPLLLLSIERKEKRPIFM